MYFDAHTHLNSSDLYPNRKQHFKNFIENNGIWLINIGVNHEYNTRGIEICKSLLENDTTPIVWDTNKSGRYARLSYEDSQAKKNINNKALVYCTIGLHPYEVVNGNITDTNMHFSFKEMCMLYAPYKEFIVGIGECGIDTYTEWSENTIDVQKDLFTQQCDLARQWNLPIVIHSRSNRDATHEVLQDFTDLTIYFHCRSYTPNEIKIIKKSYPDFYIGFTWNITYPKAIDIRKSLRYLVHENENYPEHIISWKIPDSKFWNSNTMILSNLLIETDAPYLPPQSHRGEQNEPAYIVDTYNYISTLLWSSIDTQVVANTKKCYQLS